MFRWRLSGRSFNFESGNFSVPFRSPKRALMVGWQNVSVFPEPNARLVAPTVPTCFRSSFRVTGLSVRSEVRRVGEGGGLWWESDQGCGRDGGYYERR